ncbi:MAG: hypothetical protein U0872_09200 [Planctomycetaceae bacterium]
MPDPLLYLKAMGIAFFASALVLIAGGWRRPAVRNAAGVVGVGAGLAIGYYVLKLWHPWPPTNALARLIWLVLPAAWGIELLAAIPHVPRWLS